MILWGRPSSLNVQKVLWALDEYGLDADRRVVGGRYGGLDDPEFRRLTPTAKVPVLQDSDVAIWESNAILRYLARQHPAHSLSGSLTQADPWMEFGTASLQPPFIGLFWQRVRLRPQDRNEAEAARQETLLGAALDVIAGALADGRPWLAGGAMSLADIAVGAPFHRIAAIAPGLVAGRSELEGWIARLSERPGWTTHVATSFDELRPDAG